MSDTDATTPRHLADDLIKKKHKKIEISPRGHVMDEITKSLST